MNNIHGFFSDGDWAYSCFSCRLFLMLCYPTKSNNIILVLYLSCTTYFSDNHIIVFFNILIYLHMVVFTFLYFISEETSENFNNFLHLIGSTVNLKGFDKFKGGLDVKSKLILLCVHCVIILYSPNN